MPDEKRGAGTQHVGECRSLSPPELDFLEDAVLMMLRRGIRQFFDLGPRAPGEGSVRGLVSYLYPDSVVVHVGDDLASRLRIGALSSGHKGYMRPRSAGVLEVGEVLAKCFSDRLLDRERPVGVIAVGAFDGIVPERSPASMMARCNGLLGVDSMVAVSCRVPEPHWRGRRVSPGYEDMAEMFGELVLVKPGLVRLPHSWPGCQIRDGAGGRARDRGVQAGIAVKVDRSLDGRSTVE